MSSNVQKAKKSDQPNLRQKGTLTQIVNQAFHVKSNVLCCIVNQYCTTWDHFLRTLHFSLYTFRGSGDIWKKSILYTCENVDKFGQLLKMRGSNNNHILNISGLFQSRNWRCHDPWKLQDILSKWVSHLHMPLSSTCNIYTQSYTPWKNP